MKPPPVFGTNQYVEAVTCDECGHLEGEHREGVGCIGRAGMCTCAEFEHVDDEDVTP